MANSRTKALQPLEGALPVTLERAAELAKVTEKTIRTWIAAGMPVLQQGKQGRGKKTLVDLADVLRTAMEQDALDIARTRRESAQADKIEMDNAERREQLADVQVVRHAWAELVLAFRAKMLTMPTKLAARLTNVPDPNVVAERIRSEVEDALLELSSTEVGKRGHSGAAAGRDQPGAAAAEADGKRVGRRKPAPQ